MSDGIVFDPPKLHFDFNEILKLELFVVNIINNNWRRRTNWITLHFIRDEF
jgi:hypothetical protein